MELIQLWETADSVTKVLIILALLHPAASAITAATPTPKDDKLYGKLYNFVIRPLALNIGKATQGKPK